MQHNYLVSFEFPPYVSGGLARYANELIRRLLLLNPNYYVTIASPSGVLGLANPRIDCISCRFYSNKYLSYLEFSYRLFLKYRKSYNDNKFIFFSSFSYLFNPFLPKTYYLFITNTTKRVFLTDYPEENKPARFLRKVIYYLLARWEGFLAKKATKVFVISPSTETDTVNQYHISRKKIKVISLAIDQKTFTLGKFRIRFNNKLLYVGRIVPRKNIIDLIIILNLLVKMDRKFQLHIVGGGDDNYLKKLKLKIVQYRLQDNIFFYGQITDFRLNDLYQQCDLFVFTSLVEGFGMVVLEAMAKGLPVVAYKSGGVKDIIINGKNGYLIKTGDYRQFIKKVIGLSSERAKYIYLSRNAIRRVNDFNWDRSANELINEI